MPLGLKRYQKSRQSHFVTFSCYHRLARFNDASLRDLFVTCLEQARRRYQFRVYGYVVMPEHVHLLVSEPDLGLLSTAIQALKIAVARRAVALGVAPPFWQKRYHDHNVRDYEGFVQKLRYIHRNPVTRGLCQNPADWPWSSFRHHASAEAGVVAIESKWAALRREKREPHLLNISG